MVKGLVQNSITVVGASQIVLHLEVTWLLIRDQTALMVPEICTMQQTLFLNCCIHTVLLLNKCKYTTYCEVPK